jgi:hypothetical protein
MNKHDLLDLIEYHKDKANKTKHWSTANDEGKTKENHFFHIRSLALLQQILTDLE